MAAKVPSQRLTSSELNTKYFNASTVIRRCRNQILRLKAEDDSWISGRSSVGTELQNFYSTFYTSEEPVVPNDLEELLVPQITAEENAMLTSIPEEAEITGALRLMKSDTAPGPDGMTVFFFKTYWEIVGKDVTEAVREFFFITGHLLPELNQTHLALIPKVENPSKVSNFCPISLCNVIYKLIAKILAERLKGLLPKIISPPPNQHLFQEGLSKITILLLLNCFME